MNAWLTAAPTALFSTTTPWGGVAANLIGGWACAADANTIDTQGTGISITGTTIGIAPSGVTSTLIQDGTIAAADLAANYGDCGSYSIMSCSSFRAGQPGPACNNVPVGGLCRVVGAPVCAGTGAGVCGDGSAWYLKVSS